jgi:hypothetical protein
VLQLLLSCMNNADVAEPLRVSRAFSNHAAAACSSALAHGFTALSSSAMSPARANLRLVIHRICSAFFALAATATADRASSSLAPDNSSPVPAAKSARIRSRPAADGGVL